MLFSVDYQLNATLHPAEASAFTNFAYVNASLSAQTLCADPRNCQTRGDSDELNIQLAGSFPSDVGSFQGHGTLNINVPVEDGDYFYFNVRSGTTANVSAVPLPSTGYLFACGLMGLLGLSRYWNNWGRNS